jgi:hypothetical protein
VLPAWRRAQQSHARPRSPTIPHALLREVALSENTRNEHVAGEVDASHETARAPEEKPAARLARNFERLAEGHPCHVFEVRLFPSLSQEGSLRIFPQIFPQERSQSS